MIRVCPKRDAICPHGTACTYAVDRYSCKPEPPQVGILTTPEGFQFSKYAALGESVSFDKEGD